MLGRGYCRDRQGNAQGQSIKGWEETMTRDVPLPRSLDKPEKDVPLEPDDGHEHLEEQDKAADCKISRSL